MLVIIFTLVAAIFFYKWLPNKAIAGSLLRVTSWISFLEFSLMVGSSIYRFGYLGTQIRNEIQFNMLMRAPACAFMITFSAHRKIAEQQRRFWQEYHRHDNKINMMI